MPPEACPTILKLAGASLSIAQRAQCARAQLTRLRRNRFMVHAMTAWRISSAGKLCVSWGLCRWLWS